MPRSRPHVSRSRPKVVLIVETSLASGRAILKGIADYVRENVSWSIYHEPRGLDEDVPSWLKNWDGDGVIARVQNQRIAKAVARSRLPVVDVLGLVPEAGLPLVHVDDRAIARLGAEHLRERGFKHFGFCGIDGANWSDERRDTFYETVTGAGFDCSIHQMPPGLRGRKSWDQEEKRLVLWLQQLPKPAGVMVCNDPRGQQVLEACRRAEIAVPEEVAVLGVDNDEPVCEVSDPPLSSVVPDHHGVGYRAAELLSQLMARRGTGDHPVYLPPLGLVCRQSTDILAIEDRHVALAVRFIRQHAADGINVGEVIDQAGLSRNLLKRRFRQILGRTIHDEIVRVRIKRAQQLLAETELPIGSIAARTGFRHQEYMGVVFKAQTGETPGSYRRRMQGKSATGV